MNIAVLFGGISPERNVSITGGKAVIKALKSLDYNVKAVDPAYGKDGLIDDIDSIQSETQPAAEEIEKFIPRKIIDCINSDIFDDVDVAFIVLHGKYGEDGLIQALLELRGIPYTGSDVKSSALAMDKAESKLIFASSGISYPEGGIITPDEYEDIDFYREIRKELGNKIVIKPNDQGSTIGISIITTGNLDDMKEAVLKAGKYSETVIFEKFIEGREITCGIVGNDILPLIEIVPEDGFYDFEHKYQKGKTQYLCPAELSDDITEFIQNMSGLAFQNLGCSGFGRVDFRLSDEGQPYCLEVNTIPGFTETSLVPMAAKEVGTEFPELCKKIIEIALENFRK